jgi:Eukaryotic aspartyl protease
MLIGLVENNITNSMTFSLYLSPKSLSSPTTAASQIIFGGIDPSLYLGTLYEFDSYSSWVNAPYGDQYYYVQISDIAATSTGASLFNGDPPYPILVDSGTVQILLLQDQADAIGALANATYHNSTSLGDNYFVAHCSNIPFNDTLTFTLFGQLKIEVPWTDIVNQNTGEPGQCIIPIGYAQHAGVGILVRSSIVSI